MSSQITTHILDTSLGKPATDVDIQLEFLKENSWDIIGEGSTDKDGRVGDLLEASYELVPGYYCIKFFVLDYFEDQKRETFYPIIDVYFEIKNTDEHYHVPLLLNPFGYSTYQGS